MRILHLANIISENKGGGIHEVVTNLYRFQKAGGHEPHIWYPGPDMDANSVGLDEDVVGLPTYGPSKYGILKNLFSKFPSGVAKFDIIHQHGIWMPISIYSKRIRKKTKTKSVVQPHGLLLPNSRNNSKIKKQLAWYLYEKSNILQSDAIVACANDEAISLKDLFPDKKIAIIPNGVSLDFYNAPFEANSKYSEKYKLLFLSQIIPAKGLERLFRVISSIEKSRFKDWELIIAGYENKKYKSLLIEIASKLDISHMIKFVGPKYGKEKLSTFDSATAFILPSYSENYGIVIAEALSRRIPVIATSGTPWKELNEYGCGFWVNNDEDGIKSGLLSLLNTPIAELKEMGERGRTLIGNKYLWNIISQRTIELYKWLNNEVPVPDFII